MKTPKASGALRQAPDPTPRYARFTHPTPLRCISKIGWTRAGAPPWPNPGSATDCHTESKQKPRQHLMMRLHPLEGNKVIQSFGHSKVVLPIGIMGTVLSWWDVSIDFHHYTESLLSVIKNACWWPKMLQIRRSLVGFCFSNGMFGWQL